MCLLVEVMWNHINSKESPPSPLFDRRGCGWMSTGYHSEVSARSLEEDTKQSVRAREKLKETHISG